MIASGTRASSRPIGGHGAPDTPYLGRVRVLPKRPPRLAITYIIHAMRTIGTTLGPFAIVEALAGESVRERLTG